MISPSPPPDDLPDDPDALEEELLSHDEIEEAYQRALAAFESAHVETDTDEDFHDEADAAADLEAGDLAPPAPAGGTSPPPEPVSVSAPISYDEIPVDLTSWTDDERAEPPETVANVDPAETGVLTEEALEEQAHAEFEALQAQLPPETQAAWQVETLATIQPVPPVPPAANRPAASSSQIGRAHV